jgi:hypothetical protein
MDDQQQGRLSKAAEQFASAVVDSYRTAAERGVSAQELNAQLTQQFFNTMIESLSREAEATRGASQELAEQTRRAQEATRTLTQESLGAYMEFMNSMFSFVQVAPEAAERSTREAQRRRTTTETPPPSAESGTTETQRISTEASAEGQAGAELPLEDYDSLTIEQISQRLDDLSAEEIRQLRAYEAENKNRSTLLRRLDERIKAGSPS